MTDESRTRSGVSGPGSPGDERPVQPTERNRSHEGAARPQRPVTSTDAPAEEPTASGSHGFHGGSDGPGETQYRDGYDGMTTDHNEQRIEEANRKMPSASGESSGVEPIDKLNEGARQVLGDANVDYNEAEIYMEPDDAALDAAAKVHGDRIERLPDGTHEAQSVATGPADDPAGGWGDKPVGRKGDRVFTQNAEEAEELRSHWGE